MTQRLKFYALGVVGELAQSQGNCSLAARKNASTTVWEDSTDIPRTEGAGIESAGIE